MEIEKGMMNRCYDCKHRGAVHYSAHSRCDHPLAKTAHAADKLDILGNAQGVKGGWFRWPVDYDPVWLVKCNGFELRKRG